MYKIALIPGDGIGPEVTDEAMKVFGAAADKTGFKYETIDYDFGGDRYLETGEILPNSALDEFRQTDAIYLGAIGHPDVTPGHLGKKGFYCAPALNWISISTFGPSSFTPVFGHPSKTRDLKRLIL